MAHLRSIERTCQGCDSRKAKVELFTNRNASIGVYCDPCAQRKLREWNTIEAREAAARP